MKKTDFPSEVVATFHDLMKMEHYAVGFNFLPRHSIHSILSGKHGSKLRGRGLDFDEVRNYVPGDDVRNIDWKVTARTKKTHVKVFHEEKERPALIVVDQSNSMFFGSQHKLKSVVAAELAAIAGFRVLKSGDRIGGLVISNDEVEFVRPQRNRAAFMHFLQLIAKKNLKLAQETQKTGFSKRISDTLARVHQLVTHDFLVIVISDFVHYDEEVIKNLVKFSQHNDLIVMKVNDNMELDIPNEKLIITDGEKQIPLEGNKQQVKSKMKEYSIKKHDEFEDKMKAFNIPVLKINTEEPSQQQLRKLIGGSIKR